MKVYGYAISHEYGNTTLVSASLAGAVIECAAWCRQNWTATARAPKIVDDQKFIDRYIEAHDQEQLDPFETDLALDVNDLRVAYCAAIDAGHTLDGDHDWMARYVFTGGIMPSVKLLSHFNKDVERIEQWIVDGTHYEKTSNAWLEKMDQNRPQIMPIFKNVYGEKDALKWWIYWRIFFMSVAELLGYRNGQEWVVAHYLFKKKSSTA